MRKESLSFHLKRWKIADKKLIQLESFNEIDCRSQIQEKNEFENVNKPKKGFKFRTLFTKSVEQQTLKSALQKITVYL